GSTISGVAISETSPSKGSRQAGESAQLQGESQGRLPSLSGQDPLLQIVTSTASTAAPLSILSRGSSSLGPGLDIGFREDPVNIAATAAATDDDASPAGRNGNNGIGHGSNTRDDDRPRPAENGRSAGEE
ncbi:unnamed protein product, partial [Pylaiella littoralis]